MSGEQLVQTSLLMSGDQDEDALEGDGGIQTPVHFLANLPDIRDYTTHVNQLILIKQLVDHGANVNAVRSPHGKVPLHFLCFSDNVTNLNFVEYLVKEGADPNTQQQHLGKTTKMICRDMPSILRVQLGILY
jgi:hypothetical protein